MLDVTDTATMLDVVDRLVCSYDAAMVGHFVLRTDDRRPHDGKLATVHGLATHAHVLAAPTRRLLGDGEPLQAAPLLRVVYESALTAMWVAQTNDGAEALANSDLRGRRALAATIQKVPGGFGNQAANIAHLADLDHSTTANASARFFEQLCDDLEPGGAQAYLFYRVLSQFTHASLLVTDYYVAGKPDGTFRFRSSPEQPEVLPWAYLLAAALTWAGRSVDFFDQAHRRRSELRRTARDLGIVLDLQPALRVVNRERGAPRT